MAQGLLSIVSVTQLLTSEKIGSKILVLRGKRVLLDADLAELYGVTTKRLNEQLKRNIERFPEDFTFQLNPAEKSEVVAICDHLRRLKFSPTLPYAFTEYGALMLASVLKSPRAVQVSIQVVRAFVRFREILENHRELAEKLQTLENRYDARFKIVFDAIRQMMFPKDSAGKQIGFENPIDKGS